MKCVITGKETLDKTNNIPLHREARVQLNEVVTEYNQKVKDNFVKEQVDNGTMKKEFAEKIAPQFTKAHVLRMIERDSVEGIFETLEQVQEDIAEGNKEEVSSDTEE